MNFDFPIETSSQAYGEFLDDYAEAHQEMENAAVRLECHPEDPSPLQEVVAQLDTLRIGATKLSLTPLTESLDDAITAFERIARWGACPPRLGEFILLFIDRVSLLVREAERNRALDMRKTQHLLVALQHLVLAQSPDELDERTGKAIEAITREIYENLGEKTADDVLFFDDESEPQPPQAVPEIHVPKAACNPLAEADAYIAQQPQSELWRCLAETTDGTLFPNSHAAFTLRLVLAINFLDGEPLDSEALYLGACLHDTALPHRNHWENADPEALHDHPLRAARLVETLEGPETARDLVLHHHELLNGSGYPHGLKGDAISDAGRLMAIVDTFHTLMENRGNRPCRRNLIRALAEINASAGALFDRRWVTLFNRCIRDHWIPEQNDSADTRHFGSSTRG